MKLQEAQQDSISKESVDTSLTNSSSSGQTETLSSGLTNDSIIRSSGIKNELNTIKSGSDIDSLFLKTEKRQKQIEAIKRKIVEEKKGEEKVSQVNKSLPKEFDVFDSTSFVPFKNLTSLKGSRPIEENFLVTAKESIPYKYHPVNGTKEKPYSNDLFLSIILGIVSLVIFTKISFKRYIGNYFYMAFNYQLSFNLFRDKNVFQQRFNIIMNVVYILVLSIYIYQITIFFDVSINPGKIDFVYIAIFVVALAISRYIILKTVGEIFNVQREFSEYLFNQFMFNKILGLLLIPLVLVYPYVPEVLQKILVFSGIIMIGAIFLMKLFRGFSIIVKKDILIFYVLLYLCTLEILPILVGFTYLKISI